MTGRAGRPGEHLQPAEPDGLLQKYEARDVEELRRRLWAVGSTGNGVFGLKQGFSEPRVARLIDLFRGSPGGGRADRLSVWENAFPNHRHVFMIRRNKVRLAVSWWRAIQSGEWHRARGKRASPGDVSDRYDYGAIDKLLAEAVLREAGIQELLAEGGRVPLTVAYEDHALDYQGIVRSVLRYLAVPCSDQVALPQPPFCPLADEVSEAWVQRFRREKQAGWRNVGW